MTRKARSAADLPETSTESGPRSRRAQQRELAPDPAAPLPAVIVASRVQHPLLYRKRVRRAEGARPGDLVAVYDDDQQLLGYGLYNPRSEIALRMLWYGPDLPDDAAWQDRFARAVSLRRDLLRLDGVTDAYRLVHAEADGLSGIVVDRFADVLSAEVFSLGMYQRAAAILARLAPLCGAQHTLVRTNPAFLSQEGSDPPPLASPNLPAQVTVHEHGTRFRVHFAGAHKTGFFCDQRDNRKRLAEFSTGKSVLDVCCYTGAFAVQAKRLGQAAEVTAVDLDEAALEVARENANLNQVRVRFVQADAFAYLRDMLRNGRQFDIVVLDPPKLIRSRAEYDEGKRKHFDLNRLAMQLIRPGGLLLSCSCSGLLPEAEFLDLLIAAARQPLDDPSSGPRRVARPVQILARTGAAGDHPVAANCLETEYLKAVWMLFG